MIAVDTSVAIAAFASWHESHPQAVRIVRERPALPAPCALELYAVLTRLPPPHRARGAIVRDYLGQAFPGTPLTLPDDRHSRIVHELVAMGITGGASYDAVIAMIAAHHGCQLVTLDLRARATYDRVGVAVQMLA